MDIKKGFDKEFNQVELIVTSIEKNLAGIAEEITPVRKQLRLYSSMTDEIIALCNGEIDDCRKVLDLKSKILNIIGAACEIGKSL